mgnify:CR=1 FL=1
MGKIDNNKQMKRESLLDSAFSLFIDNGFNKTSISDIVNNAGVAKGTFYLYFKDKYDIRNSSDCAQGKPDIPGSLCGSAAPSGHPGF